MSEGHKVCEICSIEGTSADINFGICWPCANAMSIIDRGLGLDSGKGPVSTAREKLTLLVENGWMMIEVEDDEE